MKIGDGVPVEGYSKFVWTMLATACEAGAVDVAVGMPLAGAVCASGLMLMVLGVLRRLGVGWLAAGSATLGLAVFPPFAVWATRGLETECSSISFCAIGLPVAAVAWGFPAYAILTTGDFMAMGRFLVPGLPFQALLLAWLLREVGGTSRLRGAIAGGLGVLWP